MIRRLEVRPCDLGVPHERVLGAPRVRPRVRPVAPIAASGLSGRGASSVADSPDWGPDGRLAISRSDSFEHRPDSAVLGTIAADGSDLRLIGSADSGLAFASEPTWTPDGRLLVGTGDPASGAQWLAWVDPADGSAERLPWDLVTTTPGIQRAHHHLRPDG